MDIYEYSDKIIKMIDKRIIAEFNKTKATVGFDELNYFKPINKLYSKLDKMIRKYFKALAEKIYAEAEGDVDEIEELDDILYMVYNRADSVTNYVYSNEIDRKKAYLVEALESCTNRSEINNAMNKAMKLLSRMASQYADEIAFNTWILALKSKGYKKVKWITEEDTRVCLNCLPLNNKVYPIDKIPAKPHWACRCWVEPVE